CGFAESSVQLSCQCQQRLAFVDDDLAPFTQLRESRGGDNGLFGDRAHGCFLATPIAPSWRGAEVYRGREDRSTCSPLLALRHRLDRATSCLLLVPRRYVAITKRR